MWRLSEKIRIKRRNEILWSNNCRRRNFFGKKKEIKRDSLGSGFLYSDRDGDD